MKAHRKDATTAATPTQRQMPPSVMCCWKNAEGTRESVCAPECGGQRRGSRVREREVEHQFVEAVRAAGGQALKFTSQSMNGVPDRLVLLLGGKCAFVELKAPGKQMRLLQRKRRQQLEALGFPVFCVDRPKQIQPALDALIHWNPGEPIPQGIGAKIPDIPQVTLADSGVMLK